MIEANTVASVLLASWRSPVRCSVKLPISRSRFCNPGKTHGVGIFSFDVTKVTNACFIYPCSYALLSNQSYIQPAKNINGYLIYNHARQYQITTSPPNHAQVSWSTFHSCSHTQGYDSQNLLFEPVNCPPPKSLSLSPCPWLAPSQTFHSCAS